MMEEARGIRRVPNWVVALFGAIFFASLLFRDGITNSALVGAALLFGISAIVPLIEEQGRPLRSYLWFALASFAAGLALVAVPLIEGQNMLFGTIVWMAVSVLGLIWVVYFERTEAR